MSEPISSSIAGISPDTATVLWNGPTCPTCHRGYLGAHQCAPRDILAEIQRLLAVLC